MVDFEISPWDVAGNVDYEKVITQFGVTPMEDLPSVFDKLIFFRRKLIFAHRDFGRILVAIKNKQPFVMMTGLMPTGKFHIGHMVLAKQIIFYQSLGAKIYIAVADLEAYHAREQSLEKSKEIAIEQYIKNYIALGLKPENCEIYFQSERSNLPEKSNAYYRLQNILSRYATFNEFKAVYGDITPGKMLSAVLQGSDMLHSQLPEFNGPLPVLIPVGIDQDPHIRLTRGISRKVKDYDFIQLSSTYHKFIPGLKGGKMSASDATSFVALTDTPAEAKKKINKYALTGGQSTVEEQREKGGNPDGCVVFEYLKMLMEEDDTLLAERYENCKSGKILCGECKKYLIDKFTEFLETHQKARNKITKKDIEKFLN